MSSVLSMAGFLSSGAGLLGVVDNLGGATEDSDSSATGEPQTSNENKAVRGFFYIVICVH